MRMARPRAQYYDAAIYIHMYAYVCSLAVCSSVHVMTRSLSIAFVKWRAAEALQARIRVFAAPA